MKADIVIRGNAVFTSCEDTPFPGGVAVVQNRISAVCKGDEINGYIGPDTKVYDCGDKLIMPGLVDGHEHLWWGAVASSDHFVDITFSRSEEDACDMIKKYADSHPDEERIRGSGWFPARWSNAPLPTRQSLDEIVPDKPVYMICADAHSIWMNTKAIEECGYTKESTFEHGSLSREADGTPAGVALEPEAMEAAWGKFYYFPDEQVREITLGFMDGLAANGVTAMSEMTADPYEKMYHDRYSVFKKMSDAGEFKSRVFAYTNFFGRTDFTIPKEWQKEFESPMFRINGVKGFVDGVTSTYTGLLLEPYADKPETRGDGAPLISVEGLNECVVAANAAGFAARLHCIADGSVRMALDAFELSNKVNGNHGLANSVEHIETIDPADIPRFKELGVIASVQGEHIPLDENEKILRVGEERCRWEWPFRSLLDAGAPLAFGTDYPVVPYNQFVGIHAAVARENYDGSHAGVENNEYITVAEALYANTMGSAAVYMQQDRIGSLEEGKLADIIVVDRNLFTCPVSEIKEAKVDLTMLDGKVIFER